ncbi:von Willebrand factor type A domain protein [Posidoniimonas polymericola]|uniref:von Willebrand factor type A domain protein n=1 Tax=Posidoniimonas polymericola TaxID=2528002 RepID=A0A5C5YM38_9BACT|nr:VWA domain-containing protein [Posidoniimonas polymericola]TWT75900.1 von Willebrand factor type A domain protein [Posidoniimonas polymericola]
MRFVLLTALAAALPLLTPATPRCGAAMPEVLFVLDSSGSMSEDAGGQRKIDAAKQVMHDITPALPEEVLVGLVAYGHRRPGDCTDIEVLMPAGSSDRQGLLSQVDRLEPRGKTPITSAVLTAAGMLKGKDAVTSIVLVSDGVETCAGDPCRVVRELKSTGCKFVLHAVGFAVDAAAAKQLGCLAKAGGGKYFAAADGDALLAALNAVSQEVAEDVEQAKIQTVAGGTGLGKLRLAMPKGAQESLRYVEIARASDGKVVKTITNLQADDTHPLLSGEYRVTAGFATPNNGESTRTELGVFTIATQQTRDLELGSIAFNLPESLASANNWNDRLHVETVVVKDSGTGAVAATVSSNGNGYYTFKDKPLLPGVYDVELIYSASEEPSAVARRVVVKPGSKSTVTLDSGVRFVRPEQKISGWRVYRRPEQSADAAEDQGAAPERELVLQAQARPGIGASLRVDGLYYPYLLPAGTYDFEIDVVGMTEPLPAGEAVEIHAGELLRFETGL